MAEKKDELSEQQARQMMHPRSCSKCSARFVSFIGFLIPELARQFEFTSAGLANTPFGTNKAASAGGLCHCKRPILKLAVIYVCRIFLTWGWKIISPWHNAMWTRVAVYCSGSEC